MATFNTASSSNLQGPVLTEIGRRLAHLPSDSLGGPPANPEAHELIELWTLDPTDIGGFQTVVKRTDRIYLQITDRDSPIGYAVITSGLAASGAANDVLGVFGAVQFSQRLQETLRILDAGLPEDAILRLLHIPAHFTHAFWVAGKVGDSVCVISTPHNVWRLPRAGDTALYPADGFLTSLRGLSAPLGLGE
jgi:hypothetical protein